MGENIIVYDSPHSAVLLPRVHCLSSVRAVSVVLPVATTEFKLDLRSLPHRILVMARNVKTFDFLRCKVCGERLALNFLRLVVTPRVPFLVARPARNGIWPVHRLYAALNRNYQLPDPLFDVSSARARERTQGGQMRRHHADGNTDKERWFF